MEASLSPFGYGRDFSSFPIFHCKAEVRFRLAQGLRPLVLRGRRSTARASSSSAATACASTRSSVRLTLLSFSVPQVLGTARSSLPGRTAKPRSYRASPATCHLGVTVVELRQAQPVFSVRTFGIGDLVSQTRLAVKGSVVLNFVLVVRRAPLTRLGCTGTARVWRAARVPLDIVRAYKVL